MRTFNPREIDPVELLRAQPAKLHHLVERHADLALLLSPQRRPTDLLNLLNKLLKPRLHLLHV